MNFEHELLNAALEGSEYVDTVTKTAVDVLYRIIREKCLKRAKMGLKFFRGVIEDECLRPLDNLTSEERAVFATMIRTNVLKKLCGRKSQMVDSFVYIGIKKKPVIHAYAGVMIRWKACATVSTLPISNVFANCPVCMERKPAYALTECGHLFCGDCSSRLLSQPCPVCRTCGSSIHPIYES